jgi:TonB family protein
MKALVLCCLLLAVKGAVAQQSVEKFYKDPALQKEIAPGKASYKKTEILQPDGSSTVFVTHLATDCVIREEYYSNNKPCGVWVRRSAECTPLKIRDFTKLAYAVPSSQPGGADESGVVIPQVMPRFGENDLAVHSYLGSQLQYPEEAKEAGESGTVYIRFIVQADGSVKMDAILRGVHPLLDLEAWEVIERMPAWKPAEAEGKPVSAAVTLPIKFTLR